MVLHSGTYLDNEEEVRDGIQSFSSDKMCTDLDELLERDTR